MYEEARAFVWTRRNQPMQLDLCGISYCDGSYHIARNEVPIYVFEYVVKGTGTVRVNGKSYTASAGDVYIIPEGSDHEYFSDEANPWIKIFFNVRGRLVGQLLKTYGLSGRVVIPGADLLPLFLQFYDITKTSTSHDEIIDACARKLLEIIQRLSIAVRENPTISEEALRLKAMMDSHVSDNISIEELANAVFRSKDYVIKLFKREFGETPHAYFLRQKISLAQSLLSGTKLPIKQVAAAVGYEEQHYFSNVFRKETGMSPLEYRRNT